MKKLLLSAAILTAFVVDAKAMTGSNEDCPDRTSLLKAIGTLHGEMTGQSVEFTDKNGQKWRGSNFVEHASRVNLGTGAEPTFTHEGSQCHVTYNKPIDTEEGRGKGTAPILDLDLVPVK
ncbi:MAG: hypothetical protein K2Y08_03620 [Alphaproteobacteria bacterium]|nr:hypothetical protein [Alphaproteobacteria bacterium]